MPASCHSSVGSTNRLKIILVVYVLLLFLRLATAKSSYDFTAFHHMSSISPSSLWSQSNVQNWGGGGGGGGWGGEEKEYDLFFIIGRRQHQGRGGVVFFLVSGLGGYGKGGN